MESVRVHGLEIAYRRVGTGPPLVLLHGAASDGRSWEPQLRELAEHYTVIAWDEPGSGASADVRSGFELGDYALCLAGLIGSLGLGPVHLGGLSWGGTLALALYRHRPELVASLVLADTYAGWKGSLSERKLEERIAASAAMLAAMDEADRDPIIPGLFAGEPPPDAQATLAKMAADVRRTSLTRQFEIMAETDLGDVLPRIGVPALLIWGAQDERSPLEIADEFERLIPACALVVIPDCGHMSNIERAPQFNRAVREFLPVVGPGGTG